MSERMMGGLRKELPPLPAHMTSLPVDDRGYPVPKFVAWVDGKPDFRVADGRHLEDCIKFDVCWLCGRSLGRYRAYVIGPMCAINRVSSEPPSHRDCAIFAAMACPFLVRPHAKRRDGSIPDGAQAPAGEMIRRNPGVALVWVTTDKTSQRDGLFDVGKPIEALWFCEGRAATRAEALGSIESGLPLLERSAQEEGDHAVAQLEQMKSAAMALLPGEAA